LLGTRGAMSWGMNGKAVALADSSNAGRSKPARSEGIRRVFPLLAFLPATLVFDGPFAASNDTMDLGGERLTDGFSRLVKSFLEGRLLGLGSALTIQALLKDWWPGLALTKVTSSYSFA